MWVKYGLQHQSDEGKVDIVGGQSVKVNLTHPSMHMKSFCRKELSVNHKANAMDSPTLFFIE